MLLLGQELLEHVDALLDKVSVECLSNLIKRFASLPLVLLSQDRVLSAVKTEEFLLVLVLKLVEINIWLFSEGAELELARLFDRDQVSVGRELYAFFLEPIILPHAVIVLHLNSRVMLLHGLE